MNRIAILLLALFTSNIIFAQNGIDWKLMQLKGKVKSLKTQWTYRYKKNGMAFTPWEKQDIKTYSYNNTGRQTEFEELKADGSLSYRVKSTYDMKAGKSEQAYFDKNNQPTIRKTILYDEKGRMIELQEYKRDGQQDSRYTYTYDAKGNKTDMTSYKADGTLYSKTFWVYDAKGNATDWRSETPGYATTYKKFVFDDKGNMTEETWIDGGKNVTFRFVRVYDAQGNKIEESKYKDGNTFLDKTTWKYEYDKNNNWIKRTQYTQDGMDFHIEERTIAYY